MGGAVSVPGNLCCGMEGFDHTQEFNIFVDPPAAATMLYSLPAGSVSLVPLDATNQVSLTRAYAQRLAERASTTGPAKVVSAIANHPDILMGIDLGRLYWWEPMAAMAAVHSGVVTFEATPLEVVTEGASAGRTRRAIEGGGTLVGVGADAQRFEELLLESLTYRP